MYAKSDAFIHILECAPYVICVDTKLTDQLITYLHVVGDGKAKIEYNTNFKVDNFSTYQFLTGSRESLFSKMRRSLRRNKNIVVLLGKDYDGVLKIKHFLIDMGLRNEEGGYLLYESTDRSVDCEEMWKSIG